MYDGIEHPQQKQAQVIGHFQLELGIFPTGMQRRVRAGPGQMLVELPQQTPAMKLVILDRRLRFFGHAPSKPNRYKKYKLQLCDGPGDDQTTAPLRA